MRDPRYGNIALDANALDYDGMRDGQVDRLLELHEMEKISLMVPGSVLREAANPKTPARVRSLMANQIYSLDVSRTRDEQQKLLQLQQLLQGNARAGKHDADGEHLFEAQKYCTHFITHDGRIIQRRGEIAKLLGNTLTIFTVEEFFEKFDAPAR